tara:strand:- start:142 stop:318 length:177 start_codon:yes stop_codon:yes gene_type:complete
MTKNKEKLLSFIKNHQKSLKKIKDGSLKTPNKKAFLIDRILSLKRANERYKKLLKECK